MKNLISPFHTHTVCGFNNLICIILSFVILLFLSCTKETPKPDPVLPTITTTDVSAITTTSASSGGNITFDGGAAITDRGICWGLSGNPTVADTKTSDGAGLGSFTSSIAGLTAGTTYHARAYARNSVGTAYGSDVSFTTTAITYPVTITYGANGTATSPKEVAHGTSFEVKATPNIGFMTDSITVNGLKFYLNGTNSYTVMNNLKAPIVSVTFKPDPKWILSQHPWYTVKEQNRYVNTIPWYDGYYSTGILINKYEFYQSGNDFKIKTSWPDKGGQVFEYVCTLKGDSLIWAGGGHSMQIIHLDSQSLVLKGVIKYYNLPDWTRVPEKDLDVQYFFQPERSYQ